MKKKSFTLPPFKFLFLFVIAVSLFTGLKAEAMPEAAHILATFSPVLPEHKDAFVNQVMDLCRYDIDVLSEISQEISVLNGRITYTQEQAEKEIAKLIDEKILPSYILEKGKYSYDGNINAVYPIGKCKFFSEPTTESKVKLELYAYEPNENAEHGAFAAYDYFGEWTSSENEEWVMLAYNEHFNQYEIGFLNKKQADFATNAQVREIANAVEFIKIAQEISSSREELITEQYEQQLQQAQQQYQQVWQQLQQAQKQSRSNQNYQRSFIRYYCRRCGYAVSGPEGYVHPTPGGCRANRSGPHDWVKLE